MKVVKTSNTRVKNTSFPSLVHSMAMEHTAGDEPSTSNKNKTKIYIVGGIIAILIIVLIIVLVVVLSDTSNDNSISANPTISTASQVSYPFGDFDN